MEAWVSVKASLKQAFADMLQHDAAWVAVIEGDRYLGVLTPDSLHAALRRSVDESPSGDARTAAEVGQERVGDGD
jgi:osmoprotectant transport system ATP-binding protein